MTHATYYEGPPMDAAKQSKRQYREATTSEPDLGPLQLLPGTWKADGTGWNMIALPFKDSPGKFRVLMNQYDETLKFTSIDGPVPNRGLPGITDTSGDNDQFLMALDYEQTINQVVAEDFPDSGGLAGGPKDPIHHEPGLWLYIQNMRTRNTDAVFNPDPQMIDIARLATIPHGNSVTAIGTSAKVDGLAPIPDISGLPIGTVGPPSGSPYLAPYQHYIDNPFMGNVTVAGFPGFHPENMNAILQFANSGLSNVEQTTVLTVDSTLEQAGIVNIPFADKQADPVSMKSTFWIQEIKDPASGEKSLRLQYSQVVMLDFFRPRRDEFPGRIKWPHISIATLTKVAEPGE